MTFGVFPNKEWGNVFYDDALNDCDNLMQLLNDHIYHKCKHIIDLQPGVRTHLLTFSCGEISREASERFGLFFPPGWRFELDLTREFIPYR